MKKLLGVIFFIIATIAAFEGALIYVLKKNIDEKSEKLDIFKQYYNLLNQWMARKNHGFIIADELKGKGYADIGIYGMGSITAVFIDEIKNAGINVLFIADKASESYYEGEIPLISPEKIPGYYNRVDAIIITPIGYYDEIYNKLSKLGVSGKAVSIAEVIYYS